MGSSLTRTQRPVVSAPPGRRSTGSAPGRLDENQLPPVHQLCDGAGLLDLRVRVANRVVQGLDVDAWDLHDAAVIPRASIHHALVFDRMITSDSRVFAPDLLAGTVALVTGGGTGLGRAAATELAACGARVVICGRREEGLRTAAARIGADFVAGDVREPVDAKRILQACLERHGRLDTLVNNAGGQYFVPAEGIEPKGWRAVTRLNVGGTELMTRTAAELAFLPAGH